MFAGNVTIVDSGKIFLYNVNIVGALPQQHNNMTKST